MAEAIRTRCKFRCVGVEDTEYAVYEMLDASDLTYAEHDVPVTVQNGVEYKHVRTGKFCQNVRLAAQYDTAKHEDLSFAAATPSGELKIYVSNPAVIGTFKPGRDYYLDLIPV
jgi:hypothetical protein